LKSFELVPNRVQHEFETFKNQTILKSNNTNAKSIQVCSPHFVLFQFERPFMYRAIKFDN